MTDDGPRGLMTDREMEILLGDADVSEKYYGVVVTRVRKRINRLSSQEIEALEAHNTLADELRDAVCKTRFYCIVCGEPFDNPANTYSHAANNHEITTEEFNERAPEWWNYPR